MGFDNGDNGDKAPYVMPADFDKNLESYTEAVAHIGEKIKAGEVELSSLQSKIAQARVDLEAAYSNKIDTLETQIKSLTEGISGLEDQHDKLVVDIDAKQVQLGGISLDFSAKQKQLDDSWADFHTQANTLLLGQKQLKIDQDALTTERAQLTADQADFKGFSEFNHKAVDELKAQAQATMDQAASVLADAHQKLTLANAAQDQADADKQTLANKLAAAQPILDQAAAIAAQKIQNDADAKINSAAALQNQTDANEIKIARVVLNNQNVDLNTRTQALQQAEAALAKGITS